MACLVASRVYLFYTIMVYLNYVPSSSKVDALASELNCDIFTWDRDYNRGVLGSLFLGLMNFACVPEPPYPHRELKA